MRATFPLGRDRSRTGTLRSPEAAGPAVIGQVRHVGSAARQPVDGVRRGDRTGGAGRRPAGVSGAGQAMTNAGMLAGFAQEARS